MDHREHLLGRSADGAREDRRQRFRGARMLADEHETVLPGARSDTEHPHPQPLGRDIACL